MKFLYTTIFIFSSFLSYSQSNNITKRILKKSFKKSIRHENYSSWDEWSGYWETNNIDSTYYKSDTIILTNKVGLNSIYCNYITWEFYKKNAFILGDFTVCKEPPTGRAGNANDLYTIVFEEENDIIYLKTRNLNTETTYKVVSFEILPDKKTLKLEKISQKTINR